MRVEQLTSEHKDAIKPLFGVKKWMGVSHEDNAFISSAYDFENTYYVNFCNTYLSGLNSYHAFGAFNENGEVIGFIGFYESSDNAEWYWTHVLTKDAAGKRVIPAILDAVIDYNEKNGRLKFYSMWNAKYAKVYRRLAFSEKNNERYDSFDEYMVPAKHRVLYTMPWMVLYGRILLPVDSLVRCTFLKQKYREKLLVAGKT